MKEIKSIIKAYKSHLLAGKKSALATLVHLDGSSYRRPGARLLVDEMGNMTGAISGGCLEGDAYKKAANAIASGKPKLVTYDTSDEEDATIGAQLGCAGIIRVLFEPLKSGIKASAVQLLEKACLSKNAHVVVTLFYQDLHETNHPGTCLVFDENLDLEGLDLPANLVSQLRNDAKEVFKIHRSKFIPYDLEGREIIAFLEYIPQPISLVIVGAGNDAIPLAEMADILGWEVTIVDGRNNLARQERFTPSCQIVVSKPESVLERLNITHRTAFVLMTHNYNYDFSMLQALVQKDIRYIGMLGPKKKYERMLEDLSKQGIESIASTNKHIHAPIGLEIGAETPEEIALSIISEIKAVMANASPGFLKDKRGTIHERDDLHISYKEKKKP